MTVFLLLQLLVVTTSTTTAGIIEGESHVFDTGRIVINTTTATWEHRYDDVTVTGPTTATGQDGGTDTTQSNLNGSTTIDNWTTSNEVVEVYEGAFVMYTYVHNNDTWPAEVAIFHFNGSLLLGESVEVEIVGENPLMIESEYGDIDIKTELDVSADNGPANVNHLGGYAESLGPWAGSSRMYPGGGGYGGKGGGSYNDSGVVYGDAFKDDDDDDTTIVVLGGSSGGVVRPDDNTTDYIHPRGGGSIYLKAAKTITIDARIAATGQSGDYVTNSSDIKVCAGGGSGGRIRLEASTVAFTAASGLDVTGGNGTYVEYNDSFCGSGGGGGIVDVQISRHLSGQLSHLQDNLDGGIGFPENGEDGYLDIKAKQFDNGSGGGGIGGGGMAGENAGITCPTPVAATAGTSGNSITVVSPTTSDLLQCGSITSCDILQQLANQQVLSPYDIGVYMTVLRNQMREINVLTQSSLHQLHNTIQLLIDLTPGDVFIQQLDREVYIQHVTSVIGELALLIETMSEVKEYKATTLMTTIEEIGFRIASKISSIGVQAPEQVSFVTDSFLMEILETSSESFQVITFPDRNHPIFGEDKWKMQTAEIEVSKPEIEDNVSMNVVNILYANLAPMLPGILFTEEGLNDSYLVNSRVISSSIKVSSNEDKVDLKHSVKITLESMEPSAAEFTECVFWDFAVTGTERGAWSDVGCEVADRNDTHVTCVCSHLTNFALLLKLSETKMSESHMMALEIITYVGCSLSLFGLLLSIFTLSFCFRGLNYESTTINMNLMVSLGIANIAFLAGADATYNPRLCTGVAMLLHYVYLAAFMWMLVEGVHLYLRVTRVFSTGIYLKFYYPSAYGIPAIVVGVTAGVNISAYGNETICWLSVHNKGIWAFAGPALFIILVNVAILVVVMHSFLAVKSIAKKPKIEQAKRSTRAALILLPLLGITWLFGCLAFNNATIVFQYVFAVLNSLQGFFIFIFHCLANEEVRKTFATKVRRSVSRDHYFKHDTTQQSLSNTVKRYQTSPMRTKTSTIGASPVRSTTSLTPPDDFVPGKPMMNAFSQNFKVNGKGIGASDVQL